MPDKSGKLSGQNGQAWCVPRRRATVAMATIPTWRASYVCGGEEHWGVVYVYMCVDS